MTYIKVNELERNVWLTYLHILLIADERVDSLGVLTVRDCPELLLHVHIALVLSFKIQIITI